MFGELEKFFLRNSIWKSSSSCWLVQSANVIAFEVNVECSNVHDYLQPRECNFENLAGQAIKFSPIDEFPERNAFSSYFIVKS
jgi:hypothetical protein